MKKIVTLILLLLPSVLWAQNISNVTAKQVGNKIEISYDMDAPLRYKDNLVNVYCSTDGGATFGNRLEQLSGDVFDKARQGHNTAVWDVGAEKDKLIGDHIVFEVRVEVPEVRAFTVNGVPFEMVFVQGGTFTMGATSEQGKDAYRSEKPTHSVTVGDFYIGKYEVTQAQWTAVMGGNPSYFKGDNLPVERVSWNDVQAFIGKLNALAGKKFRLPTEAEWEYVARGGNKSQGYKYAGSNNINDVAWYDGNSGSQTHPVGLIFASTSTGLDGNSGSRTHPVGTKAPNELGLYDMSGNVWEWCSDWFGFDYYENSPLSNPQGPSSGKYRVLRGGSWNSNYRDCRISERRSDGHPDYGFHIIGFRLVLVP